MVSCDPVLKGKNPTLLEYPEKHFFHIVTWFFSSRKEQKLFLCHFSQKWKLMATILNKRILIIHKGQLELHSFCNCFISSLTACSHMFAVQCTAKIMLRMTWVADLGQKIKQAAFKSKFTRACIYYIDQNNVIILTNFFFSFHI